MIIDGARSEFIIFIKFTDYKAVLVELSSMFQNKAIYSLDRA